MKSVQEIIRERAADYGHPQDNHSRTARYWNIFLTNKGDSLLSPSDICFLNILQKIARSQSGAPLKEDTIQDIQGYSENILMVMEKNGTLNTTEETPSCQRNDRLGRNRRPSGSGEDHPNSEGESGSEGEDSNNNLYKCGSRSSTGTASEQRMFSWDCIQFDLEKCEPLDGIEARERAEGGDALEK